MRTKSRKTITLEISGGFHNQIDPITARIPLTACERYGSGYVVSWSEVQETISPRKWREIANHMCGFDDCLCGPHHGWDWVEK